MPFKVWSVLQPALLMWLTLCSGAPSVQEKPECSTDPELQDLGQDSLDHFRCLRYIGNATQRRLDCSDRGMPFFPRASDPALADYGSLDFSYNSIRCLPKIYNNGVTACDVSNCAGCLLELQLQHNEIDFLDKEAFSNLTCLRSLDLSNNQISNQTIQPHHFFGLHDLRHLDLHDNPLHTLPDNVLIFVHMSHLETLNLSSCQLELIGEEALGDFSSMKKLDLSRNKLTYLPGNVFQGMTSLKLLDLRWNKLYVIERHTFAYMSAMEELRLEHNKLQNISQLAFHPQVVLPLLALSSNQFSDIPFAALVTLPKLRSLDMSGNPIKSLRPGNVQTLVQELRLDFLTQLAIVENDAFMAFPQLKNLSLRYAPRLTSLPQAVFRNNTLVRQILLDHNGLTFLPEDLLPLQRLSFLTLHGNHWHCDCKLGWAAGHRLGNTSMRCEDPYKLKGQLLETLQPDELSCPKSLSGATAVIVLSLLCFASTILAVAAWQYRGRMACRWLRETKGSYAAVYTKDHCTEEEQTANGTSLDEEVGDLDLGIGEGLKAEGEKAMIMLRNGYRRLRNKNSVSTQDLIQADDAL